MPGEFVVRGRPESSVRELIWPEGTGGRQRGLALRGGSAGGNFSRVR